MKGTNRFAFALLVIVVTGAAILAGFGLNLFYKPPSVTLPPPEATGDASPSSSGEQAGDYTIVEVTTETVQSIIATLSRPASYRRTVAVEYWWEQGVSSVTTAQVIADDGWTMVEAVLPDGRYEYTMVGEGTLYRWYPDETSYYSGPAERESADLSQRLPTYEDVLALEKSSISATRYEEHDGLACVYVEVREAELGYLERFWIAVNTGLLVAAETELDGILIYQMRASPVETPVERGTVFALPDGTTLHTVGA